MFAIEWLRRPEVQPWGDRLSGALAAGMGFVAGRTSDQLGHFTELLNHSDQRRARNWAPAQVGPFVVLFAGHIDNRISACADLGMRAPAHDDRAGLARLYASALLQWGGEADTRLVGEYAAACLNTLERRLILVRSPLRAPPLHYFADESRVIASTVARSIHACGVDRRVNRDKLADSAMFNYANEARGWFTGIKRVPLASTVSFDFAEERCRTYYDFADIKCQPRMSLAERVEGAHALLSEGTKAALAGSKRPAVMLSGGLDSPLVAAKALEALPLDVPLQAYTFVAETDWTSYVAPGRFNNERPYVEAFCAQHPRIVPHFFENRETRFDSLLPELFHTVGGAPQGLANLTNYHALWRQAKDDGCDRVLLGEFGNLSASASGNWAYSEYLLGLRWRELFLALRNAPEDGRSGIQRFLALAVFPLLPDSVWHWQRQVRGLANIYHLASPLKASELRRRGLRGLTNSSGQPNLRTPLRDRLAMLKEVHSNAWGEFSDIYYGFEQIFGIAQRDPMAYRPFIEFCAGLPSDTFLRDGNERWLAREMLRGVAPEPQRNERRTGRHNADWYPKLTRQREKLREELELCASDPGLAEIFDFERLGAALEAWPQSDIISDADRLLRESALPRALIMARFVAWAEGRNLGA